MYKKFILTVLALFFFLSPAINSQISAAERSERNFNLINETLPGYLEIRPLLTGFGGFGSNLIFRRPGVSDTQGAFVLALPLENDFAVETALALAHMSLERQNMINIIIAFLADEKIILDNNGNKHKGLRDLLDLAEMPENWLLCYLDINERPPSLLLHNSGGGYTSPLNNISSLSRILNDNSIAWSFNRGSSMAQIFPVAWDAEINSFLLTGGEADRESSPIEPQKLASILLEYSNTLSFPIYNADRHYSFLSLPGGRAFFISEGQKIFILFFIGIASLFLYMVYSTRNNLKVIYHIRLFARHFLYFFISLPLFALLFLLFRFIYFYFGGMEGSSSLISILLLLILTLLLPLPFKAKINKRAWFYGFSGVIWVVIGMVIAIFMDFTQVLIFLYAYCFVLLGASLSNPLLIFLSVFLLALPIPYFISDPLLIIPQIFFLTLPIPLLIKRGIIILKMNKKNKRIHSFSAFKIIPALMAIVILFMTIQILSIDRDDELESRYIIDEQESLINLSLESVYFRDSRILKVALSAEGNPLRFDIELKGENNGINGNYLPVYSATVPFSRREEGRIISFIMGENPPNPLHMEIVLPGNYKGDIHASAIYIEDHILNVSTSKSL